MISILITIIDLYIGISLDIVIHPMGEYLYNSFYDFFWCFGYEPEQAAEKAAQYTQEALDEEIKRRAAAESAAETFRHGFQQAANQAAASQVESGIWRNKYAIAMDQLEVLTHQLTELENKLSEQEFLVSQLSSFKEEAEDIRNILSNHLTVRDKEMVYAFIDFQKLPGEFVDLHIKCDPNSKVKFSMNGTRLDGLNMCSYYSDEQTPIRKTKVVTKALGKVIPK